MTSDSLFKQLTTAKYNLYKVQLFIFLLLSIASFSQEDTIQKRIQNLQLQIEQSSGAAKLQLMDSLCTISKGQPSHDVMVQNTIDYAFEIDSVIKGFEYTFNHINYLSHELFDYERAVSFYQSFETRQIDTLQLTKVGLKEYGYIKLFGGIAIYEAEKPVNAIPHYKAAEQLGIQSGNKRLEVYAKNSQAFFHSERGELVQASKILYEALDIARKAKDTLTMTDINIGLADLYGRLGFYDQAMAIRKENTELNMLIHAYDRDESHRALVVDFLNGSIDAELQGKDSTRVALLESAFEHLEEPDIPITDRPLIMYNLLRAYSEVGLIEKAKQLFRRINDEFGAMDPIPRLKLYHQSRGAYYLAMGNYQKAKINYEKALKGFKDANQIESMINIMETMATIHEKLGNINTSYNLFKEAHSLQDSVLSVQKTNALLYYQTLYETEKRDFKIAAQQSEINILDLKNQNKKRSMLIGSIVLVALFTIVYLIRSRKFARLKQKLQEQFSRDLINEQEQERLRIARELHDSVGQKLVLLKKKTTSTGQEDLQDLTGNTLEELRTVLKGLHPEVLKRLGVSKAIRTLVNEVDENSDIFFTVDVDEIDDMLNHKNALHLYRIIQESLNNIIKHSEAKSVSISVEKTGNGIEAIVKDNGKGFTVSDKLRREGSLGMKTLMERAKIMRSKLDIISEPNKGTAITLNISA